MTRRGNVIDMLLKHHCNRRVACAPDHWINPTESTIEPAEGRGKR
jgi:hypothetical protein